MKTKRLDKTAWFEEGLITLKDRDAADLTISNLKQQEKNIYKKNTEHPHRYD